MPPNLSDDEVHGLMAYARDKFGDEPYPFAPALRPIREVPAKLDPKPFRSRLRRRSPMCRA
jgi:hypothetical protein